MKYDVIYDPHPFWVLFSQHNFFSSNFLALVPLSLSLHLLAQKFIFSI